MISITPSSLQLKKKQNQSNLIPLRNIPSASRNADKQHSVLTALEIYIHRMWVIELCVLEAVLGV